MKKVLVLSSIIVGILTILFFRDSKKSPEASTKVILTKASDAGEINSRQNILLTLLKQHKSLQMKEIEKRIQTVNVRTLRRDLDKLQKLGFISKTGSTKAAVYRVK